MQNLGNRKVIKKDSFSLRAPHIAIITTNPSINNRQKVQVRSNSKTAMISPRPELRSNHSSKPP